MKGLVRARASYGLVNVRGVQVGRQNDLGPVPVLWGPLTSGENRQVRKRVNHGSVVSPGRRDWLLYGGNPERLVREGVV